jgi:hypothetical protein
VKKLKPPMNADREQSFYRRSSALIGGQLHFFHSFYPIMQLHEARMHRPVFEVKRGCFQYIGAKFFPSFRFCEDGVAKRAREIASFFRVANLND